MPASFRTAAPACPPPLAPPPFGRGLFPPAALAPSRPRLLLPSSVSRAHRGRVAPWPRTPAPSGLTRPHWLHIGSRTATRRRCACAHPRSAAPWLAGACPRPTARPGSPPPRPRCRSPALAEAPLLTGVPSRGHGLALDGRPHPVPSGRLPVRPLGPWGL